MPQNKAYLALSEGERAKGFVRPVRTSYIHVEPRGPEYLLRALTEAELERFAHHDEHSRYEEYPEDRVALGRFWTKAELDRVARGCGALTTMHQALAETYARDPGFYGATYCVACSQHLEVGEFKWEDGTTLGS